MPPQELTYGNPKQRQYTSGDLHGRKVNPYNVGKRSNQFNYIYDDDKLNTLYDFRFAPSTPTSRLARLNTYADGTPIEGELANLSLLDLQMSMQQAGLPVAGQQQEPKPGDFITNLFLNRAVIPIADILNNLRTERKEAEPIDAKIIDLMADSLAEIEKVKKSITKKELVKVADAAIIEESKAGEPSTTEQRGFGPASVIELFDRYDFPLVSADVKDEDNSSLAKDMRNRDLLSKLANNLIGDWYNIPTYGIKNIVDFYLKLNKEFPEESKSTDSKNYNAKIVEVKRMLFYIIDKLNTGQMIKVKDLKILNKATNQKVLIDNGLKDYINIDNILAIDLLKDITEEEKAKIEKIYF